MTENRVIVAGAGPAGLVAAALLADEGIPVLIVEQARDLPDDLRASTFHPPTLDMLDRFGVTGAMIEQGLICPTWQFRDRHTGVIATFDLGHLKDDTNHPYRLQCEQWRLTRMLRDRLATNPGVTFLYDAKAVEVAQDADGVTLTVERADGSREPLGGRYLIGADGASSAVRKSLGIGFEGETIPEIFLTLSTTFAFHDAIDDLTNIAYISDPEEWFVLLRTASLWRVLFPTDPEAVPARLLSDEFIQERLGRLASHAGPFDVRHRTLYDVHQRVARTYHAGRVLLMGDAAHINNPLGGMGMNGGLHDAFNLGDKLVAILRGDAGEEALDRYDRQRRRIALDFVQEHTIRNKRLMEEHDPQQQQRRQAEFMRIAADPAESRAFLMKTSMIDSLRAAAAIE